MIGDKLERVSNLIIIVLLALIVGSIFAQVLFRYVLKMPLIWPEEVARFCYIWISFLGMAVLTRKGELLAVDTLQFMKPQVRRGVILFTRLLMIVILCMFAWLGFGMLSKAHGQVLPATGLSIWWLYLATPLSSLVAIYFLVEMLFSPRKGKS